MDQLTYHTDIPNAQEFSEVRDKWRQGLANDSELRLDALELFEKANKYFYGYQWEWNGIPIIRQPEDIMLQQEIVFNFRPSLIVETGVARGGSVALSSDLMKLIKVKPRVLGIDIKIFNHAKQSLAGYLKENTVELIESDSTSEIVVKRLNDLLTEINGKPILMIFDSNHSHSHVINELNTLAMLAPVGSVIMVADTIIDEMPLNYYKNRPWNKTSNPLTAVNEFLSNNKNFELDSRWNKRTLLGEFRNGILIKR